MPDCAHRTCTTALADRDPASALFYHLHTAEYLPDAPVIPLWVAAERDGRGALRIAVHAPGEGASAAIPTAPHGLADFARQFSAPVVDLSRPLVLVPVEIAKPWGREIWFTGIEARGQSGVLGEGGVLPLPWLLSIAGREMLGDPADSLQLLKILDPFPDPLYGDLYFELHDEKQEVYVVTNVDERVWPQGRGAIRYGFDPVVRAEYADDEGFRAAYLASVQRYERIRRQFEVVESGWRRDEGWGSTDPVPAATLRRWRAAHPPALRRAEVEARQAMERFTYLRTLAVGDVIQVPTRLPHALQHGVRTIEFQTPVYERSILSFAQKVLTQDHWDTRAAVARMRLTPPPDREAEAVAEGPGVIRERIVEFDDFLVDRWTLGAGVAASLDMQGGHGLVMTICGTLRVGPELLAPERALLIPAMAPRVDIHNPGARDALLLVSRPRCGARK